VYFLSGYGSVYLTTGAKL